MASMRKIEAAELTAYAQYRSATADAVAAFHDQNVDDETVARLQRRAGAYRAQWHAASRRLEDAAAARSAGQ